MAARLTGFRVGLPGENELPEVGNDNVRTGLAKSIRPMVAVHPHDETEPPAPSRLDACDRILENHRSRRLDTEPTSSLQEKGRVGLACEPHLLSHIAIDAHVDQRGQSGCLEHLRGNAGSLTRPQPLRSSL